MRIESSPLHSSWQERAALALMLFAHARSFYAGKYANVRFLHCANA